MGNIESSGTPRKLSRKFSSQTMLTGRSSKKLDLSLVRDDVHKFSSAELEWLVQYFSIRFAKAPLFHELVRIAPSIFGGENAELMRELFRVLDRNRNQVLDFDEFLYGCSVTGRGTLGQKVAFLFILCDMDEDRTVARADVARVVKQVGRFMIRDASLRTRLYDEAAALQIFHGADAIVMDRFKQRAGGNAVLNRCLGFFDAVFFPIIEDMEKETKSAQLFNRPLPYVILQEGQVAPSLLVAALAQLQRLPPARALKLLEVDRNGPEFQKLLDSVTAAWAEGRAQRVQELVQTSSEEEAASLLRYWLLHLPEPLLPFSMYEEALELANADKGESVLQRHRSFVEELPEVHLTSLRHLMGWAFHCKGDERGKLFQLLAEMVAARKNKEADASDYCALGRLFLLLAREDLMGPVTDSAALASAKHRLAEMQSEMDALRTERDLLQERLTSQSSASQKMADRISELRQEVIDLKADRPSAVEESPSSTLIRAVADWADGAAPASEVEALNAIMRHEQATKAREARVSRDPHMQFLEGAADAITVKVRLLCGRGICNKDGKLEVYPKAELRMQGEEKVLRKQDGAPTASKSADPVWEASFSFQVSKGALDRFYVQVSLMHRETFAREGFCGKVDLPLKFVADDNVDDWFALKMRKPGDKVSGEVRICMTNSSLSELKLPKTSTGGLAPESPPSKVTVYSARAASPNVTLQRNHVVQLLSLTHVDVLQRLYVGDVPDSRQHLMLDSGKKGAGGLLPVISASRDKYVELLTSPARVSKDADFLVDGLLTYGTWTTPTDFFTRVLARYVGPDPKEKAEKFAMWERSRKLIQGSVVKLLHEWVNNPLMGTDFFKHSGLKEALLAFSQEHNLSLRALNITTKQLAAINRARSQSVSDSEPLQTGRSYMDDSVFELSAKVVAEQLTVLESTLLSDIELSELCCQAWNKVGKETNAPHVLKYISWFNLVSSWVSTQIITLNDPMERAVAISKFIEIGQALLSLNNFNGVVELLSALHSSGIARLKKTWALVPKASLVALDELDLLMSTEGNFRYYRALLEKSKPPMLPYLGLLLTDLTFVDDANLTELGKGDELKKLNVEKITMLAGVYRVFRRCFIKPYSIQEMRSVRKLLQNIRGFDENELYRLSKLCEPSDTTGTLSKTGPREELKQRKLISQITSSMLKRTELDVSLDAMTRKDWACLLGSDGVVVESGPQWTKGKVLFEAGSKLTDIFRIGSGQLRQIYLGGCEVTVPDEQMCGVLSLLNPSRPQPSRVEVESASAEVFRIPKRTVDAFCQDPEQARRFYGSLALNQVEQLKRSNVQTSKLNKRAISLDESGDLNALLLNGEGEKKFWEIEWKARNQDFNMLGLLTVSKERATLSSKMLGFLSREIIPLRRVASCSVEGTLGVIKWTSGKDKERTSTFSCLAGSRETEDAIKLLKEWCEAAEAEEEREDVEDEEEDAEEEEKEVALRGEDWEALTQGAKRVVVEKGHPVMREGESYQRMYQVVRGVVAVEKELDGATRTLGLLRASETFGEMSLLTQSPASASCVAVSDELELIIIEGYYVNMLIRMKPEMGGRFYKFLAMLVTARILEKCPQSKETLALSR